MALPEAPHPGPRPDPVRSPTPMERRLLDAAADISSVGAAASGDLTFLARMLVQANLPYRDPGSPYYVRRNGDYTLTLQAPPDVGLPYGRYPRLVLAYLCREAVRTRSREIHLGGSLSAFMRAVGVQPNGGKNGPLHRFRDQAARLLSTTISCSWTGSLGSMGARTEVGTRIASRSVVWWSSLDAERSGDGIDGGWLELSRDFYEELVAHPVPLDQRVLRGLTSSFALDLYAWTTYRVCRLRRPVAIPWPDLWRQFGSQDKALRNFRHETGRALRRIRVLYPALRCEVTRESLRLAPSAPHVPKDGRIGGESSPVTR